LPGTTDSPLLKRILGGVQPGRSYLVQGGPGVGKTVLGIQIARGWLWAGRRVLYLTADHPPTFLEQAAQLELSLEDRWLQGQLIVAGYEDGSGKQLGIRGAGALWRRIEEVFSPALGDGIVFDPIDRLLSRRAPVAGQRDGIIGLLEGLDRRELSSLILAGSEVLARHPDAAVALRERVWASLALRRVPPSGGAKWGLAHNSPARLVLELEKARQPTPPETRVPYQIVGGAGLVPAPEAPMRGEDWQPRDPRPPATRVLLASADPELFAPLAEALQESVEVDVVRNGVDALARAATRQPRAVVLTGGLPRLSGYAVARALRQGRYAMPIIIVAPARRRHTEAARAYLNGASDFVRAPFDLTDMVYRVQSATRLRIDSIPDGGEERMLEVLLGKARSHRLEMPDFLDALRLTLGQSDRLSSPATLVSFRIRPGRAGGYPEGYWDAFRDLIDRRVRSGDLICHPDPATVTVLLCHEPASGAESLIARIRRMAGTGSTLPAPGPGGWRIEAGVRTLRSEEILVPDPRPHLVGPLDRPVLLVAAPDHEPRSDGMERRWGT